jgi:hypothetical protein
VTRRQANLLLVAAAWTMYVWISFVVIQTRQHTSVAFKIVHGVLALISMGFGLAVGVVGWRARRAQGAAAVEPSSRPAESAAPERV